MKYSKLKKLLNPRLLQDIDQSQRRVLLKEVSQGSKFIPMWLWGLDENALVFKLDNKSPEFKCKSAYLNPELKGIHQGCDYVIVTKYQDSDIILFCELKSNNIGGDKQQLWSSIPFVDYLFSLLKHHNDSIEVNSFRNYFVLFTQRRALNKQRTYNPEYKKHEYKGIQVILAGNPKDINLDKIIR